jgi:hypothetical protein
LSTTANTSVTGLLSWLSLTEISGAHGFVQLFVHNGCVVPASSRTSFDPFALRDRVASFGPGYTRLPRADLAAAPRMVVCRGYGTSRSDS